MLGFFLEFLFYFCNSGCVFFVNSMVVRVVVTVITRSVVHVVAMVSAGMQTPPKPSQCNSSQVVHQLPPLCMVGYSML